MKAENIDILVSPGGVIYSIVTIRLDQGLQWARNMWDTEFFGQSSAINIVTENDIWHGWSMVIYRDTSKLNQFK